MENISWLGHASFYFKDVAGNKIFFVDPFSLQNKVREKADLIFITHAHPDHFSQEDIEQIIKANTIIIAPPDILAKINLNPKQKIRVEPNKSYEINSFKFQTTPAYNNHPEKLNFHPQIFGWVGYVFELNGQKIYHAGDTDFIEEMKLLSKLNLDIALLPIGGTYTMDYKEGADAANAIHAKITIPMHYKNLNENYKQLEVEFRNLVKNSKVEILRELS
jgi:L-ascorbate metabolism protein UlaG (beta-lactamase superfamily)